VDFSEDLFEFQNGLSSDEAQERLEAGQSNALPGGESLTLRQIIRQNVFTYFNLIFLVIAVLLALVGAWRDLTFLPLILSNTGIGILQEWLSKRTLDKITLLSAPHTRVLRDGAETSVPSADLVLDDVVILGPGDQVPADAKILEGEASVNESLLTGEAVPVTRRAGEDLLSGSFLAGGSCRARLYAVGGDSYAARLTREAKTRGTGEESGMIRALNVMVRLVGIVLIPVGVLLFWQQYVRNGLNLKESVTGTVAAVIGMIPEGLYLLSSVTMAVSAARLALDRVLVHSMKSIETLARCDVLCVDKTGTITENAISIAKMVPLTGMGAAAQGGGASPAQGGGVFSAQSEGAFPAQSGDASPAQETDPGTDLETALGDFVAAMGVDNETMRAMRAHFKRTSERRADRVIPFSSEYKYSAAVFGPQTYLLGAPEFLLPGSAYEPYRSMIESYTSLGYRVMVFGTEDGRRVQSGPLAKPVRPLCLILAENPVRSSAPDTFRYFAEQGVKVKVISGDNPVTVSKVAQEAGVEGAEAYVDASQLLTDEEILESADRYTVFGRVTPDQKRLLVRALQQKGHTVAMTGDGVNDVLALRDADCSIAMASGADAASHAAQMVLLDSDFSRMSLVVAEGRRVVNNIERSAALFLVKNIFSLLLSLCSVALAMNYPLRPAQLSLISAFTIGVPGFLLSFEPCRRRITGTFAGNVLSRALPAGLTDFFVVLAMVLLGGEFGLGSEELATACTVLLAAVGMQVLWQVMRPMNRFHWAIFIGMAAGLALCMVYLHGLFSVTMPTRRCLMLLSLLVIVSEPLLRYLNALTDRLRRAVPRALRRAAGREEAEA